MRSPIYDVSTTRPALLVFSDIIDSSKYSAILGSLNYAKQLIEFQRIFYEIGRRYFPEAVNRRQCYSEVVARGDEGLLFYYDPDANKSELIYKAISFILELKGRLKLFLAAESETDPPARGMRLGAGIHYGQVALITKIEKDEKGINRGIIDRFEGFSINYAKRVESASRKGKFSQIFLSKEAATLIEDKPVILNKMVAPLKGIEENIEVYEVYSGLFPNIPIRGEKQEDEDFINYINRLSGSPQKIDEDWLKPLVVSVLFSRSQLVPVQSQTIIYNQRLMNLVWATPLEEDPILLFIRAMEYEKEDNHTPRIGYLNNILNRFPTFLPARIKMVDACWKIARNRSERAEKVFARDTAKEYLNKFNKCLTENEKETFSKIISELNNDN